jgi:hypothetical protein
VASLRQENARLREQLATAGGRVVQPEHTFQLSEGDRQELEIRGVVNIGGRMMTKDDVEAAMSAAGQRGVEIADAPEATKVDPALIEARGGKGVAGVDYVWPSVERGKIDPAVAGTPGISGPSADADKA